MFVGVGGPSFLYSIFASTGKYHHYIDSTYPCRENKEVKEIIEEHYILDRKFKMVGFT